MVQLEYVFTEIEMPNTVDLDRKLLELDNLVNKVTQTKAELRAKSHVALLGESGKAVTIKTPAALDRLVTKVPDRTGELTETELQERLAISNGFLLDQAEPLITDIRKLFGEVSYEVNSMWQNYVNNASLNNVDATEQISHHFRGFLQSYVQEMVEIGDKLNADFSPRDKLSVFLPSGKMYLRASSFRFAIQESLY